MRQPLATVALLAVAAFVALGIRPFDVVVVRPDDHGGHHRARPLAYQVSVRGSRRLAEHICGGALLGRHWLLTAAHCVLGRRASDLAVVVGAQRLSRGGRLYAVSAVHRWPAHDPGRLRGDIGLLRTARPIAFDGHGDSAVRPIALAEDFVGAGWSAIVSGWSVERFRGTLLSDELQYLNVTTLANDECAARLGQNGAFVHDSSLCAVPGDPTEQGTCEGDSGSPLVSNGRLVGVVSWGIRCASGKPDVYARVSSARSWILERMAAEP